MANIRRLPWHRSGIDVTGKDMSQIYEEVANWDIVPVQAENPAGDIIPGCQCWNRSDNGKPLTIAGPASTPYQNKDFFEWADAFVKSSILKCTAAGTLDEGRKLFTVFEFSKIEEVIPGDKVQPVLIRTNAHDGTQAVRTMLGLYRLICSNGLRAWTLHYLSRIRHSSMVEIKVEQSLEIVDNLNVSLVQEIEVYRKLAKIKMSDKEMEKFFMDVLKAKPNKETGELSTRTQNQVEALQALHESGAGSGIVGVKGTAWGAINAVTDYFSHTYGHNENTRLDGLLFGQVGSRINAAVETLIALAA